MQVFWLNGYEGTSTQELCERTGLGKGSLYNAFGSKKKPYELALQHYQRLALTSHKKTLNGPARSSTFPEDRCSETEHISYSGSRLKSRGLAFTRCLGSQ
ncbi:MAG: helix-turn-helix domain-containing protein [Chania sp.]